MLLKGTLHKKDYCKSNSLFYGADDFIGLAKKHSKIKLLSTRSVQTRKKVGSDSYSS